MWRGRQATFRKLTRYLAQYVSDLSTGPNDTIEEQDKVAWLELASQISRFCGGAEDQDADGDPVGAPGGSRKRKRTSKSGVSTRNPWHAFMILPELPMSEYASKYLAGPDAEKFINHKVVLTNKITPHDGQATDGDGFLACLKWVTNVVRGRERYNLRWLFAMLLAYDLVKLIRPTGKGHVGKRVQAELERDLTIRLRAPLEAAGLSVVEMTTNISRWALHGAKLDALCTELGSGCLFFLEQTISEDFLANKFTKSGKYFEPAMAHLKSLGLRDRVEQSNADLEADKIRQLAIRPYEDSMPVPT
ncbi:hypothetical protein MBLNU459_g0550t1 [Dothideomycetes sp. NU459]